MRLAFGQPLWGLPSDFSARTGLSDSMRPGEISELSLSDAVAFRVEFDGAVPPNRDRYWRGPVFSYFDGAKWTGSPFGPRAPGTLATGPAISYTVTMEPTNRPWLFALDLPASLPKLVGSGPESPGFSPRITRDQQILIDKPVTTRAGIPASRSSTVNALAKCSQKPRLPSNMNMSTGLDS